MTTESVKATREKLRERCRLYRNLTGESYLSWLAPRVNYVSSTLSKFMNNGLRCDQRTIANAVEFEFTKIEKKNRK